MSSSNIFSSLVSALSSATSASASTISSAISSVFASKYSSIINELNTLEALGPGADSGQLTAMLTQLTSSMAEVSGIPQAEFALVAALKSLVGKTDPTSVMQWSQTCTQMVGIINAANSSFL